MLEFLTSLQRSLNGLENVLGSSECFRALLHGGVSVSIWGV